MNNQDTRAQKILAILFDGGVPVDRLQEVPLIQADIAALLQRARGGPSVTSCKRGTHGRIGPSSAESARTTARVVELHGAGPRRGGLTWPEIAEVLAKEGVLGKNGRPITKDSARHRWIEAQKQRANEELPDHTDQAPSEPERPTIQESQIVEEIEADLCPTCSKPLSRAGTSKYAKDTIIYCSDKCAGVVPEAAAQAVPEPEHKGSECLLCGEKYSGIHNCPEVRQEWHIPIPTASQKSSLMSEEVDQLIYIMRDTGMNVKAISQALKDGHGITMDWKEVRTRLVIRGRQKSLQKVSEAKKLQVASETPKPKPQLDYYEVADAKIIAMKKRDPSIRDFEIAQALERNPGGSWDGGKVAARWTELQRQGVV
ncbi:MAG: hypothetical protein ACYDHX_07930 [Methanothrix sp.]